jgi:hypothetical protein
VSSFSTQFCLATLSGANEVINTPVGLRIEFEDQRSTLGYSMPLLGRLFGFVATIAVLPLFIWAGHRSPWSAAAYRAAAATAASEELDERRLIAAEEQLEESKKPPKPFRRPQIAPTPPYPKAVVKVAAHNFGWTRIGEFRSHVFHIKNVGAAPLVLNASPIGGEATAEPWTCQLKVGETADYELKWRGVETNPDFVERAVLFTNDPELPTIELQAFGIVGDPNDPQLQ